LQIPFVFGNTVQQITPLGNSTANIKLSQLVMRMWTSFAYDLDPNGHGGTLTLIQSTNIANLFVVSGAPSWPQYGKAVSNFVFRTDKSYIEKDDDRKEGVTYINSLVR
jgi:acetylcholinesterase